MPQAALSEKLTGSMERLAAGFREAGTLHERQDKHKNIHKLYKHKTHIMRDERELAKTAADDYFNVEMNESAGITRTVCDFIAFNVEMRIRNHYCGSRFCTGKGWGSIAAGFRHFNPGRWVKTWGIRSVKKRGLNGRLLAAPGFGHSRLSKRLSGNQQPLEPPVGCYRSRRLGHRSVSN